MRACRVYAPSCPVGTLDEPFRSLAQGGGELLLGQFRVIKPEPPAGGAVAAKIELSVF